MFAIHPDTLAIVAGPEINAASIGLGGKVIAVKQRRPPGLAVNVCFWQGQRLEALTLPGGAVQLCSA
jgi:hypothetical protein